MYACRHECMYILMYTYVRIYMCMIVCMCSSIYCIVLYFHFIGNAIICMCVCINVHDELHLM